MRALRAILALAIIGLALPAHAAWAPRLFGGAGLEHLVRTAYSAASAYARAHGNYFARDGITTGLRDAVAAALAAEPDVTVAGPVGAELDGPAFCHSGRGAELRIATNLYGDGVGLVAATDRLAFSYVYDPHTSEQILVTPAAPCMNAN